MEDKETLSGKKCKCCGRFLPLYSFGVSKRERDGFNIYCKECINEMAKSSRAKKKAESEGILDMDGHKLNKVYDNPELAKFTPRQLMQELKARGYRWDYMLEPQRKISFDKI